MLKEENPHHADDTHVQKTPEELLRAAGAMCAMQLLCGRMGVYDGPSAQTPEGFVNISDVAPMAFGDAARDALRTRIFEAEGERRFMCVHRVVAEFLGAKWLAACFDEGRSQKRIFALLRHGEGVPTSLRGLHAWIAHFSSALASQCIAADPYAVLRYGDAEKLGLTQARDLLLALKQLSEQDPYFISEDWDQHPASGLMRAELKDELLSIICTPGQHTQLSMLLIDAMIGMSIAKDLAQPLQEILFDPERVYAERSDAAQALQEARIPINWEQAISRLLEFADATSARLACNILTRLDAPTLPIRICIDTVLSHLGLTEKTVSDDSDLVGHIADDLFADFDAPRVAELLDRLVAAGKPLLEKADPWARSALADLVWRRTLQVLNANPSLPARRVWTWISVFDGHDGHDEVAKAKLGRWIRENRSFHRSLLEYVLLTPWASSTWMAGHALHDVGLGLYPTTEDVTAVLRTLRSRSSDAAIDRETWRDLLQLARSADGLPEPVRATAIEVADGDAELLAIVGELSIVTDPEWKKRQERRNAARREKRDAFFQSHRELHSSRADDVALGDIGVLAVPAAVYLG